MRNLLFGCVLVAELSSLGAVARTPKTFEEPQMPQGAEANRPYEIVWAGRTQDDHPPLIPFTSADGWEVQATVEEICYLDASGTANTTSEALANGVYRRSQVRVRYSDGTVVEANGSMTEPMRLADGTTLPPNGYRGRSGDGTVEVFSGLVDGHRVDRAASPEYVFLDGRGVKTAFPEGEATDQEVRLLGRN